MSETTNKHWPKIDGDSAIRLGDDAINAVLDLIDNDLQTTDDTVAGLGSAVAAKADQTALDALSDTVDAKADQTEIDVLTPEVNATIPVVKAWQTRKHPRLHFTDVSPTAVLTKSQFNTTGSIGLYWGNIIRVDDKIPNALGKYYMYCSTNHSTAAGGIFLAYADDIAGPWTPYQFNAIYVDNVVGSQTETPVPIWEPVSEQIYLYYHNNGGGSWGAGQRSFMASSTDGISFSRVGKVFELDNLDYPGDGHLGYAVVTRLAQNRWIANHLMGGTDYSFLGLSYSHDGVAWHTDPESLVDRLDQTNEVDKKITFQWLFFFQGDPWAVAIETVVGSSTDQKPSRLVGGPLAPDLRAFQGKPACVWSPQHSWQTTDLQSLGTFVDNDGTPYLTYASGSDIGIAKGVLV
jgi:hypothetical protein